jgi:hypothetical protein
MRGVYVDVHLNYRRLWEGGVAITGNITGCQPDSRNSTVRDERGACGNVMQGLVAFCHEAGNGGYIGSH